MFTGIVEQARNVSRVDARADGGLDVVVDLGALSEGVALGDSIAISGVCLTVAALEGAQAKFELSPETLSRTRFGTVKVGERMNVERAMALGHRLGGHLVQGHVDGLGVVRRLERLGEWAELDVEVPPTLTRYLVEKGSIAIDGVSLTIAALADLPNRTSIVTIALVPHTLDRTTLGERRAGDGVHLEADVIAKYVARMAEPHVRGPIAG